MLAKSLLFLGAAALAVNGASLPRSDIEVMKRNIIDRQSQVEKRRVIKRQSVTAASSSLTDADILNFALTLEHLEDSFYKGALDKFNEDAFSKAGFTGGRALLEQVSSDESTHVQFLTSALSAAGATPVQACNYTFPYTDVKSFLGLSQVVEGVGVSAYLGAAGAINNSDYLTAAGSILTVEARHNAFISFLNGYLPFPQPFDTPLSATSVVTLVSPFFTSCPEGSAPTITGHPALNLTDANPALGSNITVTPTNTTVAASFTGTVYCGFASGLQTAFSVWNNGTCELPSQNVTSGQVYVLLTSGPSVADSTVLAGPAIALVGKNNVTVDINGSSDNSSSGSKSNSSGGSGSSNTSNAFKTAIAPVLLAIAGAAVFA